MSRQRKRFSEADILALMEALPRVHLGTNYSETDRARDFIETFTTDAGHRVLAQITDYCSPAATPGDAERPGRLAFKEGQRWVLAEIMRSFQSKSRLPEVQEKPNE